MTVSEIDSRQAAAASIKEFCEVVSADLSLFAALHSGELEREAVEVLRSLKFPMHLGLNLDSDSAPFILQSLGDVVEGWGESPSDDVLNELAADYAAIYLNNSLAASPQESYWLDEEHLVMQKPMFQIRELLEKHGLCVENWRSRADDHLVNELNFLSYLLQNAEDSGLLRESAQFLDEHLLRWLGTFCERIAVRCDTDFYSGLALLTVLYCEELRDLLAAIIGEPRPTREEIDERMAEEPEVLPVPVQFVPGAKPSW